MDPTQKPRRGAGHISDSYVGTTCNIMSVPHDNLEGMCNTYIFHLSHSDIDEHTTNNELCRCVTCHLNLKAVRHPNPEIVAEDTH